jgi:hypothetical protein
LRCVGPHIAGLLVGETNLFLAASLLTGALMLSTVGELGGKQNGMHILQGGQLVPCKMTRYGFARVNSNGIKLTLLTGRLRNDAIRVKVVVTLGSNLSTASELHLRANVAPSRCLFELAW